MNRDYVSVLQLITASLSTMTGQQQKAAYCILKHPQDVGLKLMRAIAAEAQVKPATLSRLCRTLRFENYEGFKAPFN